MASDNGSSTASLQDQWLQHLGIPPDSFTGGPTDAGHVGEGQASTLPTFGVSAAPDGTKPSTGGIADELSPDMRKKFEDIRRPIPSREDTSGGPTYGNMPLDGAKTRGKIWELVGENGTFRMIRPNGDFVQAPPTGGYDFVVQNGRIYASKQVGHTELAQGGRVTWAGRIYFNNKGVLIRWDNASGHYLPSGTASTVKDNPPPHQSLPWGKFVWEHKGPVIRPNGLKQGPQLAVIQGQRGVDPKSQPANRETPNAPPSAPEAPAQPIKPLDQVAVKAEELDRRTEELKKKTSETQKQLGESKPQVEEAKLKENLDGLENERAAIEESLDNLAKKIEALPEMKGVGGSTTRETFEKFRERFSKIVGVGNNLAYWGGKLVNNYGLIMQLKEVFEAKTAQQAMDRAAALGGAVRDQVVTSSVMKSFLPEGPPGVSLALNLCGDNGTGAGCEPDPDKVREERQKATTDGLNEAFEKYMKEMHPELFVQGPNGTYPSDEKLWNESKKQFQEAYERHQKDNVNGRAKELAERARAEKIENGLYDFPVNRFDPQDPDADPLDQERAKVIGAAVEKAKEEGYKEGKARRDAIWKRANDLGLKDGKTGKPAGMEEIPKWPELQTSGDMSDQQALARTTFLNQLLGVYKTAFDSIAPKNAAGSAEGKLTAGEIAAQDQKAEALKRAKEYGLEDGKKGKRLRGEEIQKWREVLNREGSDRAALLHELIETYNQAFASVAPATTTTAGDGKTSAREMVARDKKAAALKRAQELGTSDGNLGQKLSVEKIKAWPEVTELEGADLATFLHQLLEAYTKAFDTVPKQAGPTAGQMLDRDKKDAALKRAREMGTRDGKAGSRVNFEDIQEWEVVTALEGTARGAFLHEFLEAYNQAFDAVPVRPTAGEMVAGDKRTAAIQRARDWGLKDGQAGKVSDMKEIQTWPAVAELEPIARGPFIAQLIGVYNKAQAEAVAMNKSPTAATTK